MTPEMAGNCCLRHGASDLNPRQIICKEKSKTAPVENATHMGEGDIFNNPIVIFAVRNPSVFEVSGSFRLRGYNKTVVNLNG